MSKQHKQSIARPTIVIEMDGGLIQQITHNIPGLHIDARDFDLEGLSDEQLEQVRKTPDDREFYPLKLIVTEVDRFSDLVMEDRVFPTKKAPLKPFEPEDML